MAQILFVNATEALAVNQEANGTMLLATKLLQAGFDAQILRFCQIESLNRNYTAFIRDITDRILQAQPKCVSFYTLWPYYHTILRIARTLKARDPQIITVLGGPQASATAAATMESADYIDYICTGEGENTVVPFFEMLLKGSGANPSSIPGLYYREKGSISASPREMPLCDLNTLPHWDDRLYIPLYTQPEPNIHSPTYFMPIDAGRGCPYSCTFCCTSHFWRRTYRLKSPQRIVEDIRFFSSKFGIRSFWFSHDAFTTNRQLVESVCDRILEEGLDIQWKCTARIDCISEALVLKMKRAGMTRIELGVETGSARMQKLINKNLNLKKARSMVEFLLSQKLHVSLFFMYGFPDETEEDLQDTLELLFSLVDMGVRHVSMSFCRFNPATAITEKYFDQLTLDPQIKILSRGIFGFEEEQEMIASHKALFPFFYHLDTPVRSRYQYLILLTHLYQQFPHAAPQLRRLYQGDNLKFYRDFYNNNLSCFGQDMEHIVSCLREQPHTLLENTIKNFDLPYIPQLKALLKFDRDIRLVSGSGEDITLRETYDFHYLDVRMKQPIEAYTAGKSEILLQKVGGKTNMKILSIH